MVYINQVNIQMDTGTIIGIIFGVICTPPAIFGVYIGIRQIVQWRKDAKASGDIRNTLESLSKKVDGIAVYMDGLPEMADRKRRALLNSGLKSMQAYKYDDAIGFFRECLGSSIKQSEKVALLILIGNCFSSVSRLPEAEGSYKEAEEIAKEVNDKEGLATALNALGTVYKKMGELDKALEHHQQALMIHKKIGNQGGEACALGNIGIVYKTKGELDKALEHHQQALMICRDMGDREGEASVLGNIGNSYLMKGETDKAFEYQQQAIIINKDIGDREGEAIALYNIGAVYEMRFEFDKALEYHQLALKIFEGIGALGRAEEVKRRIIELKKWQNSFGINPS